MFAQTRYYDVTIPCDRSRTGILMRLTGVWKAASRAIELISISRNLDAQTELMKPRGQLDAKQREAEIVAASEERQRGRDYEIEQGGNSYV